MSNWHFPNWNFMHNKPIIFNYKKRIESYLIIDNMTLNFTFPPSHFIFSIGELISSAWNVPLNPHISNIQHVQLHRLMQLHFIYTKKNIFFYTRDYLFRINPLWVLEGEGEKKIFAQYHTQLEIFISFLFYV